MEGAGKRDNTKQEETRGRRRGAVGGKQRALSNPNLVRGRQCDSAVARAHPLTCRETKSRRKIKGI